MAAVVAALDGMEENVKWTAAASGTRTTTNVSFSLLEGKKETKENTNTCCLLGSMGTFTSPSTLEEIRLWEKDER